jgi:hypothetical protein
VPRKKKDTANKDAKGRFIPGNQLWRRQPRPNVPLRYKTAQDLYDACMEYFDWVEDNPLLEEKAFHYQGEIIKDSVAKKRMPTISGLIVFLGICNDTWYSYAKRPAHSKIVNWVNDVIYDWRLSGGAAGLFDPGIVTRILGLAEKRDMTSSDGTMSPPKVIKLVPKPVD